MRNGLLQPGQDSRGVAERFFRQEAVDFVAQAHLDAAVPQPADAEVDFAVVDLLQFNGEIHTNDCGRAGRVRIPRDAAKNAPQPLKRVREAEEVVGSPGVSERFLGREVGL